MSPTSPEIPLGPVTPNVWHAFGGVWRLTARRFLARAQLLALLGLLLLLAVPSVASSADGDVKFYFDWTARFYLTLLVPVLSFLAGAGAMREEMKAVTTDYVLTRPLRRPFFLLFKFFSQLACMQAAHALALGVLVGVGLYRDISPITAALPWLLLAQVLAVTAFTAFGFFCAVVSSRYIIIGFVYAGIVEAAIGNIPTQLNRLSMTHQLRMLLHPMLVMIDPELKFQQGVALSSAVLLAFAAVMLALAAAVFSLLELAGSRANEG